MSCQPSTHNFESPASIALSPNGKFLYTTRATISTTYPIEKCEIASDGSLFNCGDAGATTDNNEINSVVLNVNGTIAYLGSNENDEIYHCAVDTTTGSMSGCIELATPGVTEPVTPLYLNLLTQY